MTADPPRPESCNGPADSPAAPLRRRLVGVFGLIAIATATVWLVAAALFRDNPKLLAMALLAYTFGLRHAVDADHIAAIDNVTRKLMHKGERPIATGLFFALGHSTIVVLASLALALAATAVEGRFAALRSIGGVVGTAVSAGFLFVIAAANILILVGVVRSFRRVRKGGRYVEEDLDHLLANRGLLSRLFRPVFAVIGKSWHMYPLGVLFGLGFDTATEIGVLGMSAAGAARGLSIWSIMVFPALFTAGMTLVDTADGVLMLGAYGWAFVKPIRKLYYNMVITFVSAFLALGVGGIEALGIAGDHLGLEGGLWAWVAAANERLGAFGYAIIAVFLASWIVSALVYRWKRYERIEAERA